MIIFELIAKFQPYLLGLIAATAMWLVFKAFTGGAGSKEATIKEVAWIVALAVIAGAVVLWIPNGVPGLQQRGGGELSNLGLHVQATFRFGGI